MVMHGVEWRETDQLQYVWRRGNGFVNVKVITHALLRLVGGKPSPRRAITMAQEATC